MSSFLESTLFLLRFVFKNYLIKSELFEQLDIREIIPIKTKKIFYVEKLIIYAKNYKRYILVFWIKKKF